MGPVPLGQRLVAAGLIDDRVLSDALEEQRTTGRILGRILLERGAITECDLLIELAAGFGVEFAHLSPTGIDTAVAMLIPESLARRHQVVPIRWEGNALVVATSDPGNVIALDDVRAVTGSIIQPVVAVSVEIADIIDHLYRLDSLVEGVAREAAEEFKDEDIGDMQAVVQDAPIVKYVNLLVAQAVADRASDIHVEPTEFDLRIRYRIDGVLHEVMRSPKSIQAGVISRLKVMSDIDISERRIPQDGRISLKVGGLSIDLRVATLPTVHGEKVVMRILDNNQSVLSLEDLGFATDNLERYSSCYKKPYGTILVTGPTGSGKSTTLYATLNQLNTPDRNVITVEDPVEYRLAGVNQVQVHSRAGLSFAAALRSILRSDPDIVLIGEIRDKETATIAIEAALTGHLVLSTLHTNDASTAPMRLVEMGVEPFLVASALDCIVAQRLARKLCTNCREAVSLESIEMDLSTLGGALVDAEHVHKARGCSSCGFTGYRGRFGLHEVLVMNESIRGHVLTRSSTEEILKQAKIDGMATLREDGLRKVVAGWTTLEEVMRVVA
ncbi:MAG: ATPase, T2SS/T4P/T4SS family [Acidimicrobiia bacterium]